MDSIRAADDLRVIRQVMDRTRRAAGRHGGWFGVLWGAIWVVGFLSNQYLPEDTAGWLWMVLDIGGGVASALIGARIARSGVRSPLWARILLFFLALAVFDGLLVWLLGLRGMREVALLITLTVALASVQVGLFTSGPFTTIGLLVAAVAVGAIALVPGYFYLAMAGLGGLLMLGGLWVVRSERDGD
jgi:hypothetical protein